jgi:hypothetical protein
MAGNVLVVVVVVVVRRQSLRISRAVGRRPDVDRGPSTTMHVDFLCGMSWQIYSGRVPARTRVASATPDATLDAPAVLLVTSSNVSGTVMHLLDLIALDLMKGVASLDVACIFSIIK